MHVFHITLAATLLFASIGSAQTMKALMFNTTNSTVVGPTNALIFTNEVKMPGVNIGLENVVSNSGSVFGGYQNQSSQFWSAVVGGETNAASAYSATVIGGYANSASGGYSSVVGGSGNVASGDQSIVVGGNDNVASDYQSIVLGGRLAIASGELSIASGEQATASGDDSIALGFDCVASASHSFAGGYTAVASNNYSFVWNLDINNIFRSTNDHSFNISAPGGMSLDLGTNGIIFRTNASAVATRNNLGVAAAPIFKVLTNDFSITNQTNMTVVDGLTISTEAGKSYIVELFPILSAGSSIFNTILQIVSSNATVYGNWDGTANQSYGTNSLTNTFAISIGDTRVPMQKFYVIAQTNAGSVSFQFCSTPVTNNTTNTIGAGSYMMAQEVVPTP